ncbi:MAG: hypothetical protein LIO57_05845 [Oscillospiraceae bacterium]|nr:hypothetical protein [Oscillospiraceae bacterium]
MQTNSDAQVIKIRLFGAVELSTAAGTVRENTSRQSYPWLLLKYLLVNPERSVSAEELDKQVWHGCGECNNGNARVRLSRLRKALEPLSLPTRGGLVLCAGGRYFLSDEYTLRTDASEFLRLCREEQELDITAPEGGEICSRALALYRGPFMEHTEAAPWLTPYREQYSQMFRTLAARTLERMKATGDETALPNLTPRAALHAATDNELNSAIMDYLMEHKKQLEIIDHITAQTVGLFKAQEQT